MIRGLSGATIWSEDLPGKLPEVEARAQAMLQA